MQLQKRRRWILYLMIPWILLGYFAGSLPFAVWIARLRRVNPQKQGSGNAGATNVARTCGLPLGVLTFFCDAFKAALPTAFALKQQGEWAASFCGCAAVLGHCFSIWLKLKGGRGISSSFGALAILNPQIALAGILVWGVVRLICRTAAAASMAACLEFIFAPLLYSQSLPLRGFGLFAGVLCLIRHRDHWKLWFKRR